MKKLVFNPELCTGCRSCEVACSFKKEKLFCPEKSRIRIVKIDEEGVDVPTGCEHCESASCQMVCPVRAIKRNSSTGAVQIDADKCIGCKQCLVVCPFGAIHFDPEKKTVFKCDLCDGDPECVKWCYTGGVTYGEMAALPQKRRHTTAKRHLHVQTEKRKGRQHS